MTNVEKNSNINKNETVSVEHIKVIEGEEIFNSNGDMVFDVKTFIKDNWFKGEAIITTSNIPFDNFKEQLIEKLNTCASDPTDPLDLKIILHISPTETKEIQGLGIANSHEMDIHLFAQEFFNSTPDAKKNFDEQISPNIGIFKKYDLGYAA